MRVVLDLRGTNGATIADIAKLRHFIRGSVDQVIKDSRRRLSDPPPALLDPVPLPPPPPPPPLAPPPAPAPTEPALLRHKDELDSLKGRMSRLEGLVGQVLQRQLSLQLALRDKLPAVEEIRLPIRALSPGYVVETPSRKSKQRSASEMQSMGKQGIPCCGPNSLWSNGCSSIEVSPAPLKSRY